MKVLMLSGNRKDRRRGCGGKVGERALEGISSQGGKGETRLWNLTTNRHFTKL